MNQEMKNLDALLKLLLAENPIYKTATLPVTLREQRKLLRVLMNTRPAIPVSEEIIRLQDIELQDQLNEKGVVQLHSIESSPVDNRLKIWQGDITRLKTDAIVNAANSQMLGCFAPLHGCIDNAIHSAAGIQLRLACHDLMQQQGSAEKTGKAKITRGYNLPAKYVIHTVGPIIHSDTATPEEELLLAECYRSCLKIADRFQIKSIAFCCISTGEFHFPNQRAAEIAIATVNEHLQNNVDCKLDSIIFNVFKDQDLFIYRNLLSLNPND